MGPGGTKPGGPRPRVPDPAARSRRRGLLTSAALSGVVLLISGFLWALPQVIEAGVGRVPVGVVGSVPSGPLNILLVGVDKRQGLTREQQKRLALGRDPGSRTDTMMLIRLSADHRRLTVVSIPRDSWVTVPGRGQHKINSAYQLGGPNLTVKTVQEATGLVINHYVEVNVLGFIKVVDTLGGVQVCLNQDINDVKSGLRMKAGKHTVDGVTALAFARTRATARSDFDRIDRQQQFMAALLHKALSAGTLTNPAKLTGFLDAALAAVTVDENLDAGTIRGLAGQMQDLSTDDVTFATVPVSDANFRTPQGESAVLWDQAAARDLFGRLKNDTPLLKPSATPTAGKNPLTVAPGRIAVRVLNGTGLTGRGAKARGDLQRVGFLVPERAGDTPERNHERTLVRYGTPRADSARTVAAAIPGAQLVEIPDLGNRIEVVVGRDYKGTKAVKVAAGPVESGAGETPRTATQNICR
ncbi:LytR family transcriptional regulator [Bailinhaonella thermotolerans]|uniref:LytR family transcriptional regulator n=1 Tax=Bailinhaonella thermotolerans TaxID=1070861 RepID=A0A3A4ALR5_9ACTN|nr:LytR family transcriptional regulator [Bailinhaonella thermotolerans]